MTGHAGTVPSSPAPIDARTPDPEPAPLLDTTSIFAPQGVGVPDAPEITTIEDIEGVPHPRYPLPTKPFQVQPPPKITMWGLLLLIGLATGSLAGAEVGAASVADIAAKLYTARC